MNLTSGSTPDQEFHPIWQKFSHIVLLAALILGIFLRLQMYLSNRPFWMDTATLVRNIVEKGYLELFGQLSGNQASPPGFLVISKFIGSFDGYSEFSLTLAPLIFSLAALVLFLVMCIKILGKESAAAAFLPFVVCPLAIFYSGEFKQYSCELFFCLAILYSAYSVLTNEFSRRSIFYFTIAGIISVWFSYSAIIVLGGTGLSLFFTGLIRRQWNGCVLLAIAGTVFAAHILFWYFVQIRFGMEDNTSWWSKHYPPDVFSRSWYTWWIKRFISYFGSPLGFADYSVPVPEALLVLGLACAVLLSRARATAFIFIVPILVLLVLSNLHLYPFATRGQFFISRLILFTIPIAFLLIGFGAKTLSKFLRVPSIVMPLIVAILVYPQLNRYDKAKNYRIIDGRSLYTHLSENYRDGDIIYVTNRSTATFDYYNRQRKLPAVYGSALGGKKWMHDLDPYLDPNGNRIWVVLTHGRGFRALRFMNILHDGNGWAITQDNFENAWLLLSSPEIPF
jgi:hypothetical protein